MQLHAHKHSYNMLLIHYNASKHSNLVDTPLACESTEVQVAIRSSRQFCIVFALCFVGQCKQASARY